MSQQKLAFARHQKRCLKVRSKIRRLGAIRLSVHRTPVHMRAQIIDLQGKILAAASTLEKTVREQLKQTGNCTAAKLVGSLIAERALALGIKKIAFDRSGYLYHGRVKALADSAREHGLEF